MSTQQLSALDAARAVLKQAGQPLHSKEITRRVIDQSLWKTTGKTPASTLNARIAVDIKKKGGRSRFQRTQKGVYALREWGLPEYNPAQKATTATETEPATALEQTFTFADAAEKILAEYANKQPAHYQEITDKMLELGLVASQGRTPDTTLNAILGQEIKRARQQGDIPRFFRQGIGHYGLTAWMDDGISQRIAQHNLHVREQLLAQLHTMTWEAFEHLIGRLLIALGFEDVTISPSSGDDELDLRGTLVVGAVIRTRMAVQVKRWERGNNIRRSTIKRMRSSLGAHEQGLIITTSDFSDGAQLETTRSNANPVAMMDGEELVRVLIAHDIGIERTAYDLIDLAKYEEAQ
jgi:restriction system protein